VRDMQYEIYCGYWIVKNLIFDTFRVKAGRSDGHSLHPGLFYSRDKAKEWIDTLLPLVAGLDEPTYKTCGESGTDKCEARAYQITARQLEFKIRELQARMSTIHARALALPKLDWGSHDQFCIWDEFNEAVQTIQELSK
jgi:hypothetical protein